MRVLITGAGGQLADAMPAAMSDHELTALGIDVLDITAFDSVREQLEDLHPDLVVNCAAYTAVDAAEQDVEAAYQANALGPRNLAVVTQAHGVPLVHISTDYVFDGTAGRAYHEYDEPCPASVYGRSKLAGEQAVRTLNPRHYIVRTAWLYSDGGNNFPNTMLGLADRDEVRVVDDQTGSPTYAPHLAEAISRLVATHAFGVWHLAGSGSVSWYGLTVALYERCGISTSVVPVTTAEFPRPAERPACSILNSVQTPRIALPSWEAGLDAFAERRRAMTEHAA